MKATKGAHVGAIKAMVMDSMMPITKPPMSGVSADPNRPIMTAAKMTPTQVNIWEGAKVNIKATQTPAQAASPAHKPASQMLKRFALIPKAVAISGSSAHARTDLPTSVFFSNHHTKPASNKDKQKVMVSE